MFKSKFQRFAPKDRQLKKNIVTLSLFLSIVYLSGCTPQIYSVDLRYQPTRQITQLFADGRKFTVTVADFIDRRQINDTLTIGRVITSEGTSTPVLPKYVKATEAVTDTLRKLLVQYGFNVSPEKISWNLQEKTIKPGWGTILVGGTIDELDVTCLNNFPIKKYSARGRISLFFADVQKKRIFYHVSSESSSSLEHVVFSEDKLGDQINWVLAEAMEKIFEGKDTIRQIRKMLDQS